MLDSLDQILKRAADKSAPRFHEPAELTAAVITTIQRRKTRKRIAISVLLIGIVAIPVTWLAPRPHQQSLVLNPPNNNSPATIPIDRQRQIEEQEKLIANLENSDQLAQIEDRIAECSSSEQDPIEQTAQVMVSQANLVRDLGLIDQAATDYRQIVSFFPNTASAKTARKNLDSMNFKG